MWSYATTDTGHAQRSYLTAARISVASWRSTSLPAFRSRTVLTLHNIPVTHRLVKRVINDLDSSKASGLDYMPVVVLKNCESGTFINISWTFPVCVWGNLAFHFVGRSHLWSLFLKMLENVLGLKTTALLVFFLSMVKSLKDLQMIDLEKSSGEIWPFFWFPIRFHVFSF